MEPAPPTIVPGSLPDWQAIREDVLCPMCEYSLRGLAEPRCPECGYTFEWIKVLDPAQRLHRYLYEHHPERSGWAFWRTAVGALRPGRFWRSLHPAQPSRPRRLVRYALLTSLSFWLVIAAALFGVALLELRSMLAMNAGVRNVELLRLNAAAGASERASVLARYGSIENYVDQTFPVAPTWPMIGDALLRWLPSFAGAAAGVVWPWLTIGALLIFQVSMRRAKVRKVHVARCVVYSFGTLLWLGLIDGVLVLTGCGLQALGIMRSYLWEAAATVAVWVVGLVIFWQLVQAYRLYMRFDRPFWTILATQIMVILFILTVPAFIESLFWWLG